METLLKMSETESRVLVSCGRVRNLDSNFVPPPPHLQLGQNIDIQMILSWKLNWIDFLAFLC